MLDCKKKLFISDANNGPCFQHIHAGSCSSTKPNRCQKITLPCRKFTQLIWSLACRRSSRMFNGYTRNVERSDTRPMRRYCEFCKSCTRPWKRITVIKWVTRREHTIWDDVDFWKSFFADWMQSSRSEIAHSRNPTNEIATNDPERKIRTKQKVSIDREGNAQGLVQPEFWQSKQN